MLLGSIATKEVPSDIADWVPVGKYDYKKQQYILEDTKIPMHMGTGSPGTYSATSNSGRDSDRDDTGE